MPAYLHNWHMCILTHSDTISFRYIKADQTAKHCAEFVQKIINKETKIYI